jgi:hypothetical protein
VDCSILDPRASVSKNLNVKIEASVGTLYKIAKAGGSLETKTKTEIENLQKGALISEQGQVKLRTLFLFCEMVANAPDISTEKKAQLYKVMMNINSEQAPAEHHITSERSGLLLPGSEAKSDAKFRKSYPDGTLFIIIGNSIAHATMFPHTVIEVAGTPVVQIVKSKMGIGINSKLFSEDRRIIAELRGNQFFLNPNNYFKIDRPNKHVLIVFDQMDEEVLHVDFIDPFTISLFGKFYLPNRSPLIIARDGITYQGITTAFNDYGNNQVDIPIP